MKKTLILCAATILFVLLFTSFIAKPVTVNGESMENTFMNGDFLIVNRLAYVKHGPKRGDCIVCRPFPGKLYVKRVVAIGGDTIKIQAGKTYINGEPIVEEYIKEPMLGEMTQATVPKGDVFVMGDNRNYSVDSREIGTISEKKVLGKVR